MGYWCLGCPQRTCSCMETNLLPDISIFIIFKRPRREVQQFNLILHCVAFISPVPDHHEFYRVGLDTVCHYDLTTPLTQEGIIFLFFSLFLSLCSRERDSLYIRPSKAIEKVPGSANRIPPSKARESGRPLSWLYTLKRTINRRPIYGSRAISVATQLSGFNSI